MSAEKPNFHVVALTASGARTGSLLASGLGATLHLPARLAGDYPDASHYSTPVAELVGGLWPEAKGFLLIMAAGIAVRIIAPLLASKYSDPAVVVFDPAGRYAVPLLSGHLGGANELALRSAGILGGEAVLTTATDAAGAPAIEVWAKNASLAIESPKMTARVNRAFAEGEPVALFIEPEIAPPPSLDELTPWLTAPMDDRERFAALSAPKIAVSDRFPGPGGALLLRPRTLALGVGSRRGAKVEDLREGVISALRAAGWSELSAAFVATIDIKKEEPAIVGLAATLGAPLLTYTTEALGAYTVPNPSARVLSEVGVAGVAESAALASSGGGGLVVEKIIGKEWTLAVARLEAKCRS